VNKLLDSFIFKIITAGFVFITLLFPAIQVFVEIFVSKTAAQSIWMWSLYALLLMISCFGIVFCLIQTKQVTKAAKPQKVITAKVANNNNKEELKKKLSQTEAALRAVIANLSRVISDLKKDMEDQDSSLVSHKNNIAKAQTIDDYVEIAAILIGEIGSMIESNRSVREKLKNAEEIINEQNRNLAKLVTETMTDHLTTVLNKRGFDKRLEEEYIRYKRYDGKLSLITLDIDHFKEVNDNYGHLFGDKALRSFAQLLRKNIREADILARVGGEEFSILLPETDLEGAVNAAEKIHGILNNSIIKIDGKRIKLVASFGVAVLRQGESKLDFIDRGDQALYLSKKEGRNRVSSEEQLA